MNGEEHIKYTIHKPDIHILNVTGEVKLWFRGCEWFSFIAYASRHIWFAVSQYRRNKR